MRVKDHGKVVAEIPTPRSSTKRRVYNRPTARPAYLDEVREFDPSSLRRSEPRPRSSRCSARRRLRASAGCIASTPHGAHQHDRSRAWALASFESKARRQENRFDEHDLDLALELAGGRRSRSTAQGSRELRAARPGAQALEFVGDGVFLVGARETSGSGTRPPPDHRARGEEAVGGSPERSSAGGRSSRRRAAADVPGRRAGRGALAVPHRGRVPAWDRLRVPRPDRGAGGRADEERLRLDRLARAADAARGDLRRRDDAQRGTSSSNDEQREDARRHRRRVGAAREDRQRHPAREPARLRGRRRRDRAHGCRRAGARGAGRRGDAPAAGDRARAERAGSGRTSPPTRTGCGRCSSTWSRTRSSTRPTAASSSSSSSRRTAACGSRARPRARHPASEHERIFEKFFRLDPNLPAASAEPGSACTSAARSCAGWAVGSASSRSRAAARRSRSSSRSPSRRRRRGGPRAASRSNGSD